MVYVFILDVSLRIKHSVLWKLTVYSSFQITFDKLELEFQHQLAVRLKSTHNIILFFKDKNSSTLYSSHLLSLNSESQHHKLIEVKTKVLLQSFETFSKKKNILGFQKTFVGLFLGGRCQNAKSRKVYLTKIYLIILT